SSTLTTTAAVLVYILSAMARALPKEVMWRIIQFVDDSSQLRATSSRWKHVGRGNSSMETVLRAKGSIPNELLVGLVLQFLDEPDAGLYLVWVEGACFNWKLGSSGDSSQINSSRGLRHIAKVWAAYLQRVAATAATVTATAGGGGEEGMVPFPSLGMSFGPATEPGPLDTTGRLPSELLESMFDYLEEDMTVNCASVARRCVPFLSA
ncbi:unnamed protein product, partial [Ectocarpus sp. 12 AP-2014]